MTSKTVESLGPGRTAVLELMQSGLEPQDLIAQAIYVLEDPDIARSQAGKAISDVIKHLGPKLPQGATELLGQVLAGKPRRSALEQYEAQRTRERSALEQYEAQRTRDMSKIQVQGSTERKLLDHYVKNPEIVPLGPMIEKRDIQSLARSDSGLLEPAAFRVVPEYRTQYPAVVVQALGNLYAEYNRAFGPLVEANKEWETDYQYCMAPDGTPINGWVQIDMVGLPDSFLKVAPSLDELQVCEALRGRVFEIENSLAMYQLLERIFSYDGRDTLFKRQFRASLDDLRSRFNRPVALLAVTDQKYQAMKQSEFGKREEEPLNDEAVRRLSGFDRFFGPEDFQRYVEEHGGNCDYLLYARTSDPISKLKRPETKIQIPLLEDDYTRRIIRESAVTFNVDSPVWTTGDRRRINDTKAWMMALGMAHDIYTFEDIETKNDSIDERGKLKPVKMATDSLINFLLSQGVDLSGRNPREVPLRAKPMQASYGCYGHTRGPLKDAEFRRELRKGLRERGPYVLQPEMQTPVITNSDDGRTYTYVDRNFMYTDGQHYYFMGGFRSLMPMNSVESEEGRNHGSKYTVWAEIT